MAGTGHRPVRHHGQRPLYGRNGDSCPRVRSILQRPAGRVRTTIFRTRRTEMSFAALLGVAAGALVCLGLLSAAARQGPEGTFLGLPYDWRLPTRGLLRERLWNRRSARLHAEGARLGLDDQRRSTLVARASPPGPRRRSPSRPAEPVQRRRISSPATRRPRPGGSPRPAPPARVARTAGRPAARPRRRSASAAAGRRSGPPLRPGAARPAAQRDHDMAQCRH